MTEPTIHLNEPGDVPAPDLVDRMVTAMHAVCEEPQPGMRIGSHADMVTAVWQLLRSEGRIREPMRVTGYMLQRRVPGYDEPLTLRVDGHTVVPGDVAMDVLRAMQFMPGGEAEGWEVVATTMDVTGSISLPSTAEQSG